MARNNIRTLPGARPDRDVIVPLPSTKSPPSAGAVSPWPRFGARWLARWVAGVAVAACVATLVGCVSPPTLPESGLVFRVSGRVGLVAEHQSVAASFVWRQFSQGGEIDLWGPLGQGRTRVVWEGDALVVRTADGARLDGGDAHALLRREFGLAAPLELLSNWMVGQPAPGWPAERGDGDAFTQLGWRVAPSRFVEVSGRRVPSRLVASRAERKLTVLCREWRFFQGELE